MASRTKRRSTSATADLRERIRSEGAEVAFETLLSVCCDPKASAQAKATAGSTLFRSAGLMEKNEDDLDDMPLENMSFAELQETIIRGARAIGAPEGLVDAVEQVSSAAPSTVPRPRRAAGKPATAEAGSFDEGGAAIPPAWLGDFG